MLVLRSRLREKHLWQLCLAEAGACRPCSRQQPVSCSMSICYLQATHMLGVYPAPR